MKADTAVIILAGNCYSAVNRIQPKQIMAQEQNCINDFALLVFKYYIKLTLSQGTKCEQKLQI